jgi:hypothetical protein
LEFTAFSAYAEKRIVRVVKIGMRFGSRDHDLKRPSACMLALLVLIPFLAVLMAADNVAVAACTCPYGGQYYSSIYTKLCGWQYNVCVSFDYNCANDYHAVCGTTQTTSTRTVPMTTSKTTTTLTRTTWTATSPTIGRFIVLLTVLDSTRSPIYGATVYLDGSMKGTTDFWGRYMIQGVSNGLHTIATTKQGYTDATQAVNVLGDTNVTLRLRGGGPTPYSTLGPTPGPTSTGYSLIISVFDLSSSAVSGATVYVDDVKKGTTDSSGRLIIAGVAQGSHEILVKKLGFQDAYQRPYINFDMALYIRLYPA